MKLTWFGHSCFLLESDGGTRILTDPADPPTGYPAPSAVADAVTVSHGHHDHNYVQAVPGATVIDFKEGSQAVGDVRVSAFASFHDGNSGKKRGPNTIYAFDIDGLRVVHLGDLGHFPDAGTIGKLSSVDVLLLPVGGVYTIDAAQAAKLVSAISPRCVVPMHYKTPHLTFDLAGVEPFLALVKGPAASVGHSVELKKGCLPAGVLVMDYLPG